MQNFRTYTKQSFLAFVEKAGEAAAMATSIIDDVIEGGLKAIELAKRSFLSDECKRRYIEVTDERRRRLLA